MSALIDKKRFRLVYLLTLTLFCFFLFLTAFPADTAAEENSFNKEGELTLYYFWGFCPVCSKPEEHVGLFEGYPVKVEIYEVFHDQVGRAKYDAMSEELGIEIYGFPTLIFNDHYWLGFSETTQAEILDTIEAAVEGRERSAGGTQILVPLIGEIDLLASPLLLTTVIIATLDGFNPCSLFVLTFLLAIIVHSASRKRIFIIGFTFLLVTSLVYGLFMLGVLNIMLFAGQLFWIRNLVAAIVIILGLTGIKDFLFFREGLTFSIPDSYKQKYYGQVRQVFYTKSVVPAITATAVMALGIALIELPCTAGFPFIWSTIVSGHELPLSYFIMLFALYIFLYLLIEIVIFLVAVIRMRSIKMTEERGRILKLIAGSLMLVLGLILLLKPEYMENIVGILVTFGSASALIIIISVLRIMFARLSGRNR